LDQASIYRSCTAEGATESSAAAPHVFVEITTSRIASIVSDGQQISAHASWINERRPGNLSGYMLKNLFDIIVANDKVLLWPAHLQHRPREDEFRMLESARRLQTS
jgi:hypothetical protein